MSSDARIDFGILLNLAFAAFKERLDAELAQAGFTDLGPSFGYVFRALDDAPLSLRELGGHLGMTPQGAMKIVDEMEAAGYVERMPDAVDGRVKRLRLTARARQALARARRFHAEFEAGLAAQLGERRAAAVRAALEAMATAAGTTRPRPL